MVASGHIGHRFTVMPEDRRFVVVEIHSDGSRGRVACHAAEIDAWVDAWAHAKTMADAAARLNPQRRLPRPRDPIRLAKLIMAIATGQIEDRGTGPAR